MLDLFLTGCQIFAGGIVAAFGLALFLEEFNWMRGRLDSAPALRLKDFNLIVAGAVILVLGLVAMFTSFV